MFDVPDMSSPSHVAPSVPATFDIDRRSRRNDRLDPMMRAGSCSQVQVRGGVGHGSESRQTRKTNHVGRLPKRRHGIAWVFSLDVKWRRFAATVEWSAGQMKGSAAIRNDVAAICQLTARGRSFRGSVERQPFACALRSPFSCAYAMPWNPARGGICRAWRHVSANTIRGCSSATKMCIRRLAYDNRSHPVLRLWGLIGS